VIDLHTHLLPGIDDGSRTVEQSVDVLERFAGQGVTAVCCTPHLRASEAGQPPCGVVEELLAALRDAAPPQVRLSSGFEIMLDVPAPVFADRCLTLAGTRYILVEFGRLVAAAASLEVLARITAQGLVPVLAHPERCQVGTPELGRMWRDAGVVLQVDATTLLAESRRAERARSLVAAGCAGIVASDNHGDRRTVFAALEWLERHGGARQARLLAEENPAAILADEPVAFVPPFQMRRSLFSQFKDFLVGGREE